MSRRGLERNEINLGIKLEARPGILRGTAGQSRGAFGVANIGLVGCVTLGFDSSSPHLLLAVLGPCCGHFPRVAALSLWGAGFCGMTSLVEQGSGVRGPQWVQPRQLGSGLWSAGSAANSAQT